ncbi:RT0821/Lpp0805 family surface protein [Paraburkholderia sp. HD33-4]|uniref:RT0821/Lpp0805 family surface protein n=1 Tax=Paraburkholderia sp. HD33-4 TaxID=2883242 RepID=UPI001EFF38A0|nr:RT0821/Lpp0805 family surface protein [Paraburkholderia sp. HD33-4]
MPRQPRPDACALTPDAAHTLAITQWFAAVALLASPVLCHATNLNFVKDTPVKYMHDADRQALNDAAQKALDTKGDGESYEWSNAGTGNSVSIRGTVTPQDTTKDGDRTCRTATLTAVAKGRTQTWTPIVCKTGDGPWEVLET